MRLKKIFFLVIVYGEHPKLKAKSKETVPGQNISNKAIIRALFRKKKLETMEESPLDDIKVKVEDAKEKQIASLVGYLSTTIRRFAKITPKGIARDGKKVLMDLSPAIKALIKDAILQTFLQGLNKIIFRAILGSFVCGLVFGGGAFIGNHAMDRAFRR